MRSVPSGRGVAERTKAFVKKYYESTVYTSHPTVLRVIFSFFKKGFNILPSRRVTPMAMMRILCYGGDFYIKKKKPYHGSYNNVGNGCAICRFRKILRIFS